MAGNTSVVSGLAGLIARLNLRYPVLFVVLALLTLVDLVVPDFVPFVDEVVLALLTLLVSQWKARRTAPAAPGRRTDLR